MGGLTSRNKGKRGEREIVRVLQEIVDKAYTSRGLEPLLVQRNQLQSHKGGHDLVGVDWIAPEVKFCEQLAINSWWQQTVRQAGVDKTPVLFYRQSRKAWRVMMVGYLATGTTAHSYITAPVDIALDTFKLWFTQALNERLDKGV